MAESACLHAAAGFALTRARDPKANRRAVTARRDAREDAGARDLPALMRASMQRS
ncbi:hypothetical protein [Pseudoxanthomonas spadix]|uniref:hypothetical protein n=1 Tax=Pseudoxanthomonas spadix TaxID=415229 RepID=UPI0013052827|nr:hypothetical protein [Pseudoxanthomonas spadix]